MQNQSPHSPFPNMLACQNIHSISSKLHFYSLVLKASEIMNKKYHTLFVSSTLFKPGSMNIPASCLLLMRWTYPILLYLRERTYSIGYIGYPRFIVCRGRSNKIVNWKGSSWYSLKCCNFFFFAFTDFVFCRAFGAGCFVDATPFSFSQIFQCCMCLFLHDQVYAGGSPFDCVECIVGFWRSRGVLN